MLCLELFCLSLHPTESVFFALVAHLDLVVKDCLLFVYDSLSFLQVCLNDAKLGLLAVDETFVLFELQGHHLLRLFRIF